MYRQLTNAALIAALTVAGTPAYAAPPATGSSTSFIGFTQDPFHVVRIDRTSEDRVVFSTCDRNGASVFVNCQPIGRPEGYTSEELNARAKSLRYFNWIKNAAAVPAGTACSALLVGSLAAVSYYQSIMIGFLQFILGGAEMSTIGLVSPTHINQGGLNIAVGIANVMMGMVMVMVWATIGGVAGAPLSWWAARSWFPKYRNGRDALKFAAADVVEGEAAELSVRGSFTRFKRNLDSALKGIP